VKEYEYEVTFRGAQWNATVIVYHEADTKDGRDEEASDKVEAWAVTCADQNGLSVNDYDEVSIVKTGEIG